MWADGPQSLPPVASTSSTGRRRGVRQTSLIFQTGGSVLGPAMQIAGQANYEHRFYMHTGITGLIRKTASGRRLLFQINSGPFWIYGILGFVITFSLGGLWIQDFRPLCLLSVLFALAAAFTLPALVCASFWRRVGIRSVWVHNALVCLVLAGMTFRLYCHDVSTGHGDAPHQLVIHIMGICIVCLIGYALNRRSKA